MNCTSQALHWNFLSLSISQQRAGVPCLGKWPDDVRLGLEACQWRPAWLSLMTENPGLLRDTVSEDHNAFGGGFPSLIWPLCSWIQLHSVVFVFGPSEHACSSECLICALGKQDLPRHVIQAAKSLRRWKLKVIGDPGSHTAICVDDPGPSWMLLLPAPDPEQGWSWLNNEEFRKHWGKIAGQIFHIG